MKEKFTLKTLLFLSITFMFLFSASFLVMPIASRGSFYGNTALLIINGIWFWFSGFVSLFLFLKMNRTRKEDLKKKGSMQEEKVTVLHFFSNKWAKIADVVLIASLVLLFVFIFVFPLSYYLFVFLFSTVFAFLMHCVFNGENFKYIIRNEI